MSKLSNERQLSSLLFVSPLIIVLMMVAGWPLLTTLYYAFTDAHLSDLSNAKFIGFGNYQKILSDSNWWKAVANTFVFTFISVALETTFGIIIALVLNKHFKGRGLIRALIFIPWAIPTIVSARLWGWMYHDVYGILNEIIKFFGVVDHSLAWTASPKLVMLSVIIVDVWKTTPLMSMMILAGLQLIPQECYEAAKIDGINPVRVFFKVTLPLLKSTLLVAMILRTLDALRVFDLIYVLTPNNSRTISMSVYAHQNLFSFQETGIGSAAASLLFLIVLSITFIYLLVGKKMEAYDAH
jgi:trehalose/maltose transport system permease protein